MPQIFDFYCDNPACEFELPSGWGGYMYAIDDDGERVTCPHPAEYATAREVIGEEVNEAEFDRRTGFNTYCYCPDCESQVDIDLNRDGKQCPDCGSPAVQTIEDLVGEPCPVCGEGTVVAEDTGLIA